MVGRPCICRRRLGAVRSLHHRSFVCTMVRRADLSKLCLRFHLRLKRYKFYFNLATCAFLKQNFPQEGRQSKEGDPNPRKGDATLYF